MTNSLALVITAFFAVLALVFGLLAFVSQSKSRELRERLKKQEGDTMDILRVLGEGFNLVGCFRKEGLNLIEREANVDSAGAIFRYKEERPSGLKFFVHVIARKQALSITTAFRFSSDEDWPYKFDGESVLRRAIAELAREKHSLRDGEWEFSSKSLDCKASAKKIRDGVSWYERAILKAEQEGVHLRSMSQDVARTAGELTTRQRDVENSVKLFMTSLDPPESKVVGK